MVQIAGKCHDTGFVVLNQFLRSSHIMTQVWTRMFGMKRCYFFTIQCLCHICGDKVPSNFTRQHFARNFSCHPLPRLTPGVCHSTNVRLRFKFNKLFSMPERLEVNYMGRLVWLVIVMLTPLHAMSHKAHVPQNVRRKTRTWQIR